MEFLRTLMGLFLKGGVFMIPLAFVALAGVVLTIERILFLLENRIDGDSLQYELRSALKDNDLDRAVALAAKTRGLVGRVMQEGLLRVKGGEKDIIAATEKIMHNEMVSIHRSRGWLSVVAQVAPLLGILGTVWGMIVVFMVIEKTASNDPRLLAGGIYQALVTTLAGLIIAIPVTVVQEYVRKETNGILHFLDLFLIETGDWLGSRFQEATHA